MVNFSTIWKHVGWDGTLAILACTTFLGGFFRAWNKVVDNDRKLVFSLASLERRVKKLEDTQEKKLDDLHHEFSARLYNGNSLPVFQPVVKCAEEREKCVKAMAERQKSHENYIALQMSNLDKQLSSQQSALEILNNSVSELVKEVNVWEPCLTIDMIRNVFRQELKK